MFGSTLYPTCLGTTQHRSSILVSLLLLLFSCYHWDSEDTYMRSVRCILRTCVKDKKRYRIKRLPRWAGNLVGGHDILVQGRSCHKIAGKDTRGCPRSLPLRALTAGQGRSTVPVAYAKRLLSSLQVDSYSKECGLARSVFSCLCHN